MYTKVVHHYQPKIASLYQLISIFFQNVLHKAIWQVYTLKSHLNASPPIHYKAPSVIHLTYKVLLY